MRQSSASLQEIISRVVIPREKLVDRSPGFWTGLGTMQGLNQRWANQPLLDFINYSLRGIGQVIFVNNPLSGLLILLALLIQSPWVGLMSLLGVISSTVTAIALKLDRNNIRNGIYGYNGILVGAALATFSNEGSWAWVMVIAICSALTTLTLRTFGGWWTSIFNSPPLTLPFNLITLLFLGLVTLTPQSIFELGTTANNISAPLENSRLLTSIPVNFGQVFLADNLIAGSLVFLAVVICTPLGAVVGLASSILGITVAVILGVIPNDIYAGLWGYNSLLAGMAIGGIFYAPNLRSFLLGAGCAFLSALAIPVTAIAVRFLGLPVLTLPFCLVTIGFFILIGRSIPSLVPVALYAVTTPEEHRQRYLIAKDIIGNFRRQLEMAVAGKERNFMFEGADEATKGDLRYIFEAIDTDRSSELSIAELASYLTHTQQTVNDDELSYLFKSMDRDLNGKIDFQEFGELMLRHRRLMTKQEAFMTYFLPIDANKDDRISIEEMNSAMNSVGEAKLTKAEIEFLQRRTNSQSFSWNQFIELLLLT